MKREQTRVEPTNRVTDVRFSYQRGADVQATWRRFGWVPPSEGRPAPPPEKEIGHWEPMRRVK
jgi:hypothetical protein